MPIRPTVPRLALPALLLAAAFALPAAAEDCVPGTATPANPAFATQHACPPRKAKPVASTTTRTTTTPQGGTLYQFGDTSVAVSGYVRADTGVRSGSLGR
ncbi:hypothetical protein EYW49_18785 [Siculibacillus lacustris]|uniref:Porin n=1 Tax=Siculibacillus lacustris TaxID=1549641 RepID=A0A4Q9VGC5_9HYPH|nr:hypothetical protein [Siculibacillus lacustris]TBW34047.1 hypothetical protein EYW49_18785 [Siculibacillus lacustris]